MRKEKQKHKTIKIFRISNVQDHANYPNTQLKNKNSLTRKERELSKYQR